MAYICSMKITATAPRICLRGALAVAAALFTFLARVHPVLAQNAPSPNTKQSTTAIVNLHHRCAIENHHHCSAINQPDRGVFPGLVSARDPNPERAATLGDAASDGDATAGGRSPL